MGGLWASCPRMGGAAMFLAMAALGLPGMGSFVGEILVLIGVFGVSPTLAIVASAGLVLATVYALWMMQQTFHGPAKASAPDLGGGELAVLAVPILLLIFLGFYPRNVFDTFSGTMKQNQAELRISNGEFRMEEPSSLRGLCGLRGNSESVQAPEARP
jgi:NADH-quinone oxidoreductase subunit M